ncbi:GNAT family N-acetyltransferase [Actinomadura parmotrematis]|uniref:GNAT family N-acetyltransferase n=1 Tax=Actinomadura parmotrematis TaxID=2864039 RepID=A0ABS7G4S1_9ACTN|nr:GNAT family N-acetyltransferase [Actinomadura parmotrematis]MBW8487678.1 GNAT family N-acetyltransferase [Actinomadura parmotrematis]
MTSLSIRELDETDDLHAACRLFDGIWKFEPGGDPLSVEALLTLNRCGNYVYGAFHGERMVGASVGIFGPPRSLGMCSYITGAATAGAGIGLALKRHQRRWAIERGVDHIFWTFDPLIRRNAHFNLVKLGAAAERYHVDYYGKMPDTINGDDESDRLLAVWRLESPGAVGAAGRPAAVPAPADAGLLLEDRADRPVLHDSPATTLLLQIPHDIEKLRITDPGLAREWRVAVRHALGPLLADGGAIIGFHDRMSYVVRKKE